MKKDKEWLKKEINIMSRTITNNGVGEYVGISRKSTLDLIDQLDEPELPVIPQFVVDVIDRYKERGSIYSLFVAIKQGSFVSEFVDWFCKEGNDEVMVRSWLDGYEVEKEKLYRVKISKDLYFAGFEELKIKFVKNDAPGAIEQVELFGSKDEALKTIEIIGLGILEEVTE